jgi:hypothetical protein
MFLVREPLARRTGEFRFTSQRQLSNYTALVRSHPAMHGQESCQAASIHIPIEYSHTHKVAVTVPVPGIVQVACPQPKRIEALQTT